MKNLNILIITAPFGNGHKMAAKSLEETFIKEGCNVMVCDLFTESHPLIIDNIKKTHIKLFNLGKPYSYLYYGVDKISKTKLINLYGKFGIRRLKEISEQFKPHIIINTFPVLSATKFFKKNGLNIPVINVVTDYCCHRLWVNQSFDRIYLATDDLKEKLKMMNIPTDKLEVTGIPIRNEFEKEYDSKHIFEKYNLSPHKKIVLISAGAQGILKGLTALCVSLDKYTDFQTVLICGHNSKLWLKLNNLGLKNIKIFRYVEEIHELYKISSLMITKPGGITLSEASATSLPLILYKPVAGQEKENAEYFKEKGGAVIAYNLNELLFNTLDLINNEEKLNYMKNNLKAFHQSFSSKKIFEDLLSKYIM